MQSKFYLPLIIPASMAISPFSFAVQEGTPVDWAQMDDLTRQTSGAFCSGMVIAGRYVLTAAHCAYDSTIVFASGQRMSVVVGDKTSFWDQTYDYNDDVGFWVLPERARTTSIHFFSQLTTDSELVVVDGDIVRAFGFGSDWREPSYATYRISEEDIGDFLPHIDHLFHGVYIGQGYIEGGDSGGVYLNDQDEIIAVHNLRYLAAYGHDMFGYDLHKADDFILSTINGWHYPTVAYSEDDKLTIKIQSVHVNPTAATAHTEGDVQIVGGTCTETSMLLPYETCTYELESRGHEGYLILSEHEYISINHQADRIPAPGQPEPEPAPKPSNPQGDGIKLSAGTNSIFAILVVGLFAIRRRLSEKVHNP